jgi:hypothetical protein
MGSEQSVRGGMINLSFRRRFGDRETLEWEELEECLNSVQLSEEVDTICWALTKNRQFSIASLYKHCASSGVIDVRMEEMWNARIPLKVRNFLWLVFQGRIQTTDNLSRKAWRGGSQMQILHTGGKCRSSNLHLPPVGFCLECNQRGLELGENSKICKRVQ